LAHPGQPAHLATPGAQVIGAEISELESALGGAPREHERRRDSENVGPAAAQRGSVQGALQDLMGRLSKLQVAAAQEDAATVAPPPPPAPHAAARETPLSARSLRPASASSASSRPSLAPYHATTVAPDDASVASWSADAFGRSRNPGW